MKIKDKKELVKLISFITMGDGSVYKNNHCKNSLFSISMVEKHEDFLLWVKDVVENITSAKITLEKRETPRQNVYKVYSLTHPFFNDIRERVYVGNYKSIDNHALKLLDFQALAILYMCDGCLGKHTRENGSFSYTTTLNLCRLSYGDQLLLKRALKDKLDLEWNIVKTNTKYYSLRLRGKDFDKFMQGINPFVFDSFKYKLDLRTVNPSEEGGDIVCSTQRCVESPRNEDSSHE